jgi:hypothetical protein
MQVPGGDFRVCALKGLNFFSIFFSKKIPEFSTIDRSRELN